ncbi:AEC family transporter [Thioclava sp. GXIMD4216]|uniref:AEC family transporter n=1 Tax=Thioclava litoralis TaxID=3076557 RepID=A0ABZ1DWQ5_9RHOB|nr:AEC family transporter [Thioclava sp. FTW29]
MSDIIRLILPIYILIVVGFVLIRIRYIAAADLRGAGRLVIRFFLPLVVFAAVAAGDHDTALHPAIFISYTIGSLLSYGLGYGTALLAGKPHGVRAFEAMGCSCSNSAFFGLPISTFVFGQQIAFDIFAMALLIENLIITPLAVSVIEVESGLTWAKLRRLFAGILTNPLLIGALSGLVWKATGLGLPTVLLEAIRLMTPVAAPIALLAVGGAVAELSLKTFRWGVIRITLCKLLGHPLLVGATSLLFLGTHSDLGTLQAAAIVNAALPMMSVYMLFGIRFHREDVAATALITATALSFFTLSALLYLLR